MLQMECYKHALQRVGYKYILQMESLLGIPCCSYRWTRFNIFSQCNLDPVMFLDEGGHNYNVKQLQLQQVR